ncbi:MAG: 7TM diverse intracellular signaling domain-containing protein [Ramlibacter sp.]
MRGCGAIIGFLRVLAAVMLCLAAVGARGAVPELPLAQAATKVNLTEHMASRRVPAGQAIDPDVLWQGESGEAVPAGAQWQLRPGQRLVGRITLLGSRERDIYVVQVPAAWVDDVQVWHREQGGSWKSGIAGDRMPLSLWPFAGQSPAFAFVVREAPIELMVMVANEAAARTPVWLMPDPQFRENRVRQANLSGLIMGLGLMVVVVTVIGAALQRRRANGLLAAVAAWIMLTVICLNGYMALWFTPESPAFNDACKHFTAVMLAGLMVALTAEALDQRHLTRGERVLKVAAPAATLVYAAVQALLLPGAWRPPGAFVWASLALAACMAMCTVSALRGGRYVRWIVAAVACFGASVALVYTPFDFVAGLDVRAAVVGVLLFSSMLLFYQALFFRERYGRDVLGRAAIAANRDPLTALLSYQGFQQACERVLLRHGAGGGGASAMLFLLPGLERSGVDYGFVLTERALVRLAAALQTVLGQEWAIARLSKTRFAAVSLGQKEATALVDDATRVLAHCSRLAGPLAPVADFDLRIACLHQVNAALPLVDMLRQMEEAGRALESGKRITLL